MTAETTKGTRVRVNIATTSKGVPSYEATVELWDANRSTAELIAEALVHSDRLRKELHERYGSAQEAGK